MSDDDEDRLAWIFAEPDPAEVVASLQASAKRALAATSSPPGYGVVKIDDEHSKEQAA